MLPKNSNADSLTLRKIIGNAGDSAGKYALKAIDRIDDMVKSGKVSQNTLKLLRDQASGLDPKRAKAFLDLIREKAKKDWKHTLTAQGTGELLGTYVDGAFVLHDAFTIYYLDDAEEKYIQATGKMVEYGTYTGMTVASTMVQGATTTVAGGFLPGIVITFTAGQLGTLTQEIIRYQNDLQKTKEAEEASRLQLWILARQKLIEINGLIQAGKLDKARFMMKKTRAYLQKRQELWYDKDLSKQYYDLDEKLDNAERIQAMNAVINKARFPYTKALTRYSEKHSLREAKEYALEAKKIMQSSIYPELHKESAYKYITDLLAAIDQEIKNATPLRIISVNGPEILPVGEYGTFDVELSGGIPYYRPSKCEGLGSKTSVRFYWQAPAKTGKQTAICLIEDDIGQVIKVEKIVNVTDESLETKSSGAIELYAFWQSDFLDGQRDITQTLTKLGVSPLSHGYYLEAQNVYPSTDVNFRASINNPNYTYRWTVDGKVDTDSRWGNNFWVRAAEETYQPFEVSGYGDHTVTVEVYDEDKKLIGSDSVSFRIKRFPNEPIQYIPGIMPEGDE